MIKRTGFRRLLFTHPSKKNRLKLKCDQLVGEACRSLGQCELCGTRLGPFHWAHFITRRVIRLRYTEENYACLCMGCHGDGHADPAWFRAQWARIKGEDVVAWLMVQRNKVEPIRETFYREVLARQ
jgi:hypothetical protein